MMKLAKKVIWAITAVCCMCGSLTGTVVSTAADNNIWHIEAEDMVLSGYIIKDAPLASGGKVIQIGGTSENPIFQKATCYFGGSDGTYNISVGYNDFFSGSSTRKVYVNDKEICIWAGNKTPGASEFGTTPAFDADTFKQKLIENVELKNGDKIDLVSRNDYGEKGEFDYIEIFPSDSMPQDENKTVFTDVEPDYWAYNDIYKMAEQSVVNGYEDGSFRPGNNIRADEFIKMFVSVLGYTDSIGTSYWAQPFIQKAELLNLLDNVDIDDYTRYITRGEIINIFSNISVLSENIDEIIYGDEEGNVNPQNNAIRAEVVAILNRVQNVLDTSYTGSSDVDKDVNFPLDNDGYVKTWCATGMVSTYKQESQTVGDFQDFVGTEPDFDIPDETSFSSVLPNGLEFIPKSLGSNVYVMETIRAGENDGVYCSDGYLATDLIAESDLTVDAQFRYQTGYYEMWCNGEKIVTTSWKYTPTQSVKVTLNLKKGVNRIFVRVRNNGNRTAISTVGLQIISHAEEIKTTLPLDKETIADFYAAEKWMQSFSLTDEGNIKADSVPVVDTVVSADSQNYKWPKYENVLDFDIVMGNKPMYFTVSLYVGDTGMVRKMQVRKNVDFSNRNNQTVEERRKAYADYLYENKVSEGYCLGSELCLKYSYGMPIDDEDKKRIIDELKSIDTMMDCSEFNLGHMLRLYMLYGDNFDDEIKAAYKHTLLNFAYWSDEEDSGRMVVGSENHKIGFYTCMIIAGNLFPDEVFTRSKRTGKQQAEIGMNRLETWISTIEHDGFEEFQSSAYTDVTLLGMLNAYDFIDSSNYKERIKALIDLMLRMTAVNTFDGVSVGAQGRVYREVIDTESSVKQRMAGYLSPKIAWTTPTLWMVPLMTSGYQIPEDIEELIDEPTDLHFMQGGTEVTLKKTKDYFMSAINLPSSYEITSPLAADFGPGLMLKQAHIMEVSIGADARTFVTHPGSAVDNTGQRPDYWYGQLTAPVSKMTDNMIMLIYNIPENSATQFSHAYWTSDQFDDEVIEKNWLFAKKNNGYIALWCSTELEKFDSLLLNREFRANNPKAAWVCIASSADESGSFDEFISMCKSKDIKFDETSLILSIDNDSKLKW